MYSVIHRSTNLHSMLCHSSVCKAWFDRTRKSLPRPLRPPEPVVPASDNTYMRFRGTKRRNVHINDEDGSQTQDVYKKMRTERRGYKNIRVFYTQLAKSPTISNVRHAKMQGTRKWENNKFLKNTWTPAVRQPAETSMGYTESTSVLPLTSAKLIAQSPEAMHKNLPSLRSILSSMETPTIPPMWQNGKKDLPGFASLKSKISLNPCRETLSSDHHLNVRSTLGLSNDGNWVPNGLHRLRVEEMLSMRPTKPSDILHATENINDQNISLSRHTAQTVISEPYWIAGSDSCSVLTTETAPPEIRVETCQFQVTRGVTSELSFAYRESVAVMNTSGTASTESKHLASFRPTVHLESKDEHPPRGRSARKVKACLRCRFLKKTVGTLIFEPTMCALTFNFSVTAETPALDVSHLTHDFGKSLVPA